MKNLNNNNRSSNSFEETQKIFLRESLTTSQKEAMLSKIYDAVSPTVSPLGSPLEVASASAPILSPFSRRQVLFKQRVFAAVLLAVFALTGTTYASATSLPGDFLYPVKTNVIEPIATTLHIEKRASKDTLTKSKQDNTTITSEQKAAKAAQAAETAKNKKPKKEAKQTTPTAPAGQIKKLELRGAVTASSTANTLFDTKPTINTVASTTEKITDKISKQTEKVTDTAKEKPQTTENNDEEDNGDDSDNNQDDDDDISDAIEDTKDEAENVANTATQGLGL